MARYYESESLIDFVKQNTPHINGETTMKCVEFAIKNAPTADVVPKSEVEKWKQINEQLHKEMSERMTEECKIERKLVAREIFAEIENTAKDAIQFCEKHLITPMLKETKIDCYKDLLGYIAELKKKYTEEQV